MSGVGAGALLVAGFFYLEFSSSGFPDGYKSELDRVRGNTYPVFIALNMLLAGAAFFRVIRIKSELRTKFLVIVVILLNAVIFTTDYICTFYFDHGGGG